MSRQTKDTKNLERVRDNQRRSRARRREHLLELEQRIRNYELQGIEASAEVQQAARRVAEENRQLRALLVRQGISDDYILSYLNPGAATQPEPGQISHYPPGTPSEAAQTLQQAMAPRRPVTLDHVVPYPIPPQEGREASIATVPTTSANSLWPPAQPIHPAHSFSRPLPTSTQLSSNHPLTPNAHPTMARPTIPSQVHSQPYSTSVFPGPPATRTETYHQTAVTPGSLLDDHRRQSYTVPSMHVDNPSAMSYAISMHSFSNPGGPNPGGPDSNPDSGPTPPC